MTSGQFDTCWQQLCRLWPAGNWTNDSVRDAWMKILINWPYATADAAIQSHWQEAGSKYSPDPKSVRKLCKEHRDLSIPPQQAELLAKWPKMSKLEQCRYTRDSYAAQARKCQEEHERERLEYLSKLYAAHAARLYQLHAEDCPPKYGDRTKMPEPWGDDYRKFGSQKGQPEAINFSEAAESLTR